jgi:hypothetical protein
VKQEAIGKLALGMVMKVVLRFREPSAGRFTESTPSFRQFLLVAAPPVKIYLDTLTA